MAQIKKYLTVQASSTMFAIPTDPTVSDPAYRGTKITPLFNTSFTANGGVAVSFYNPQILRYRLDLDMANYARLAPSDRTTEAGLYKVSNVLRVYSTFPSANQPEILLNFARIGEWNEPVNSIKFETGGAPLPVPVGVDYPTEGIIGDGFVLDLRNIQNIYLGTDQKFVLTAEIACSDYILETP